MYCSYIVSADLIKIGCPNSLENSNFLLSTGKFLSEELILASANPQYDKRLFFELRVQYMKTTSSEQLVYLLKLLWMPKHKQKNNLCTQHGLSL